MDMENMDQTLSEGEALLEKEAVLPEEACEECVQEQPAEAVDVEEERPPKKKIPAWKIATAAVAMVLVLCVLTVGLLYGMGKRWEDFFPKNDLNYHDSYGVSDKEAGKNAGKVIARVGDLSLTNDVLNIFYWSSVSNYYGSTENQYYGYLDLTVPLSEQTCAMDESKTWEQYFLEESLENWHSYAALYLTAQKEGYQYSQEILDGLAKLPEELEAYAREASMESVDALVKRNWGSGVTEAGYLQYEELMTKSMTYFSDLYEKNTPSADEAAAFFDEHAAEFEQAGYGKDAGNCADVRHILIKVDDFKTQAQSSDGENSTEPTEGTETTEAAETTQEVWDACYAEADRILALWKSGEATEDSFAALVQEYTDDAGSATTGGLYQGIMPGSGYVKPFLEWAVSSERQSGDTGIVQVDDYYQGYHIMYYVSGQPVWQLVASNDLLAERMSKVMEDALEAYPMETDYKKIVLGSIDLGN